jgi:mannosyltransferase
LLGLILSLAFSWVPSLWYDEAATVSATTRTWAQLGEMLGTVDAVHGLYYAGMHLWFDLVGYSPFALRLPSAVATGLSAALLVLLVRRLRSPRVAVIAGIVFCLLPRVTWMGAEGRSYAFTVLAAILISLAFERALRRGGRGSWLLYAILAALSIVLFIYLSLVVLAHGITLAVRLISRDDAVHPAARSRRRWLGAAAMAAILSLPVVLVAALQSGQVSWIDPIGDTTARGVLLIQWFYKNPVFAVVAWLAMVAAAVLLFLRRDTEARRIRSLALPWLILPTAVIIAVSVVGSPLYSPRYLSFSIPAVAILIAVAIDALRNRWLITVAVLAMAAIAAPQYAAQRMPEAKQGASWTQVTDYIEEERTEHPAADEGIIYGPLRRHSSATTRVIAMAYPEPFDGMVDIKLKTPAAETGRLWESRYPLEDVMERFDGLDTVWLVTSDKRDWRPSITSRLATLGFALEEEEHFPGVNVLRYAR